MPKTTPAEAAAAWRSGMSASVSKIQTRIDRVQKSPGVSAVENRAGWVAAMTNPQTHDKWARKTAAVDLSTWKTVTKAKVASNLSAGATAAEPKLTSRYTDMFPYMQSLEDRIKGMPKITLSDSIARATAWMTGMAEYGAR